jgi:hypothetical protein
MNVTKQDLLDRRTHDEELDMWQLSNFSSDFTGVDGVIIWLSSGGCDLKYGPRIKVKDSMGFDNGLCATIPLDGQRRAILGGSNITEHQLDKVYEWINVNMDLIIDNWNDKIYTSELINKLKKI